MTILDILKNNNWKSILEENGIKYVIDKELVLVKYDMIGCNFSEDWTKQCRGSIINLKNYEYVCRPFDKFFNSGESRSDISKINWNESVIYEKLDGSLIKMWWYNNKWNISTNGTMYSGNAPLNRVVCSNFEELVYMCIDKDTFFNKFDELDKEATHMFELCTPENKVVVPRKDFKLYYLSSRVNKSGIEYVKNNFKDTPKVYKFSELECYDVAKNLPYDQEGYVVYCNGHRVKIKSPAYVSVHHVATGSSIPSRYYDIVKNGEIDEIVSYFPEMKSSLLEIELKLNEVREYIYNSANHFSSQVQLATFKDKALWIKDNYKYNVHLLMFMRSGSLDKFIESMDYKQMMCIHDVIKDV